MKKNKIFYISLIISIVVIVINIIAYPFLPDKVPVHWGINGEVNRYGSRLEHLVMSALPLVLVFFLNILPSIDPKKESYQKHSKPFSIINLFVIILISGMNSIALLTALGHKINFSLILPIILGLFFIGVGNYLSQIRPNYFIGIRTPWTLASEYVWRKTHRFGGFVFIIIGIIHISSILIGELRMFLFIGTLIIGVASIYLYSFLLFKRLFSQRLLFYDKILYHLNVMVKYTI